MLVRRRIEIETEVSPERWAEVRALSAKARAEMTPEEDAAITADAMSDPDSIPMTDEEFANARRLTLAEALPLRAMLTLDADVVDLLEKAGEDWEARANAILRQALDVA